ncbi:2-succinylbenzoate--CoA ligase-like [Teleopsis dalmanni]|uniref:2-succinylbenzoate--CoA ligase-like n=1 Tax=Teleopsis dalmanni TaxID=139649 RepID=UPI0018CC7FD1|nr:2-succinylbenzoate--CoA ligase-like [Teleopsis dalmanni]
MKPQTMVYDSENKIWKSNNYAFGDYVKQTLGEIFLKTMSTLDEEKVLEYFYDTGIERTAGEIYSDAVKIAINLQRLGVEKGDVVVLYSMNNPKISALAFGCYLIGAVVNYFETKFEQEHIDYALSIVDPKVILFEDVYETDIRDSLNRSPLLFLKYLLSIDSQAAPNVTTELLIDVGPTLLEKFKTVNLGDSTKATASLVFTSGSTGIPKAVDISHALLINGFKTWWCQADNRADLQADSILFSFSPIRWISQVDFMLQSILLGLKRVCASGLPSGAYGREIIQKGGVTHFFSTPVIFTEILRAISDKDIHALDSLRIVHLGGEPPSQALIDLARQKARNSIIYRCYGMTEVSSCISNDEHINGGPLLPGLQMKVLDDNLQPVGPNIRGQLCIKAPVPFKGYLKMDNSKYYFDDGFFLTGDFGFMDEKHNLHVESRYKDLVRAQNGILIPNPIESLVADLPEVTSARLVGYKKSPEDAYDVGAIFVALKDNFKEDERKQEIRSKIGYLLESSLSTAQLDVIRHIHFIDTMPLTSAGKVNRVTLRQQAQKMTL